MESDSDKSSIWQKCFSSKQNAHYWLNLLTSESQWTDPNGESSPRKECLEKDRSAAFMSSEDKTKSKWIEKYSESHKRKYYYNTDTAESLWELDSPDANSDALDKNVLSKRSREAEETYDDRATSDVPMISRGSNSVKDSADLNNLSAHNADIDVFCPEGLEWKRKYLFRSMTEEQISKLQMDEVASYSVTEERSAETITRLLHNALGRGASSKKNIIFDGMACVGGNTISFASVFDRVISNELDSRRFRMLNHNVTEVMNLTNVTFLNGSILDLAFSQDRYDILFLDPEWGGPEYKNQTNLRLVISTEPVEDFCLRVFERCPYLQIVALKLPVNYDNLFVENFARMNNLNYTFHTKDLKRMTLSILSKRL